jgi:hypothetical protein
MLIQERSWELIVAKSAAVLLGVALLLGGHASASDRTIRDGNDTSGVLDVRSATHGHAGAGVLTHRIKSREVWGNKDLQDSLSKIVINFEVGGDPERELTIDLADGGGLKATMRDFDSGRIVGRGHATRTGRRGVQVEFKEDLLGSQVGAYAWQVVTAFQENGHRRCDEDQHGDVSCVDRAPNSGMVRHQL